ncbi:MAG: ribosome biogenesis GTP-binding protein YihA/YsxC [Flavobacteriales bacterium]
MEIRSAEFVSSYVKLNQLPRPEKPEYAFIGRSNVGKSSLINMLTGRKYLAKISSTPGKTQTINHFIINNEWYLVDLPGFGYAKTSKTLRALWKGFTFDYLKQRENLLCVCVLLDSRLEPQKIDLEFMEWLGKNGIPFVMVFTKADKNTKRELAKNLENYQRKMLETWEFLPQIFVTSAEKQTGKEELLAFFDEVNERF